MPKSRQRKTRRNSGVMTIQHYDPLFRSLSKFISARAKLGVTQLLETERMFELLPFAENTLLGLLKDVLDDKQQELLANFLFYAAIGEIIKDNQLSESWQKFERKIKETVNSFRNDMTGDSKCLKCAETLYGVLLETAKEIRTNRSNVSV